VTLTFEEAATLPKSPIRITRPGGAAWSVGTPTISGPSVTAPVVPSGPQGAYTGLCVQHLARVVRAGVVAVLASARLAAQAATDGAATPARCFC
jgi:hypothetical protein